MPRLVPSKETVDYWFPVMHKAISESYHAISYLVAEGKIQSGTGIMEHAEYLRNIYWRIWKAVEEDNKIGPMV